MAGYFFYFEDGKEIFLGIVSSERSTRRHTSEDSTLLLIKTSFVYNNFWVINSCLQQSHPPT
jgi:hypothetical protein